MRRTKKLLVLTSVMVLLQACSIQQDETTVRGLFTRIPPERTRVLFSNNLTYTMEVNPFSFHNFYNGGGVAIGDINNDNLPDLFFCGNQVPNRLYINKGNFRFEDVSAKAGISSEGLWYTGATFADVNGDGLLDIFVCRAAHFLVGWRGNQLFINQGDLTFKDMASEYGLANAGFSTHCVFFDYDNDSDLDCYLLSNSNRSATQYNPIKDQRKSYVSKGGNKLYRNDGMKFIDVTEESGIYSSVIGFGLGVTISDINKDGWQDIYVSNDFFEKDYLYINKKNGTFQESLEEYVREISLFSMGADIADINNDAYPEIYVTDMLPEDEGRLKAKTTFENWEKYQSNVSKGYYHQFLRNVLQLNRGPVTDKGNSSDFKFSEIGRFAGVHATDWSWGSLIADFDNDGFKDIFVSNGMYKDVTDQDFIQFVANDSVSVNRNDYKRLIDLLESNPVPNYFFHNNGDLTFTNRAVEWGLGNPGFSNGSAYADLDNDGDLDLVTSNINDAASIYRNNTNTVFPANTSLTIILRGPKNNSQGFGAKVTAFSNGVSYYVEQMPARGFQSSVDPRLHLGLGKASQADSMIVEWPGEKKQILRNVKTNQTITFKETDATNTAAQTPRPLPSNTFHNTLNNAGIDFVHHEDSYVDFDKERLTYQMLSTAGPKIAVGDVNGDKRDDLFIGGAHGQAGALYIQKINGSFARNRQPSFEEDKMYEDTDCLLFDADGDMDNDLVVCSGGNIFNEDSPLLKSRLYFNDGKGNFTKSGEAFYDGVPEGNASSVSAADYDNDGDNDLLLGIRSKTGNYGAPASSVLLQNNGQGRFTNVTDTVVPTLNNVGMVSDVDWLDYNKDGRIDFILTGEYLELKLFENKGNGFTEVTQSVGLTKTNGWWNRLVICDVNKDGFPDIIAGNHGLNSRFKASPEKPVTMYYGDFDQNNKPDQIICVYNGDKQYPMALRHDLVAVMPSLKKKFLKYADYKEKTIEQILDESQLNRATKMNAYELRTMLLLNNGKGSFIVKPLPAEAQFSPVFAIEVKDFTQDGHDDILLGGNFYQSKPEIGIYDGMYGQLFRGDGTGNFESVSPGESNFVITGAIRDIHTLKISDRECIVVSRNNDSVVVLETRRSKVSR